MTREEALRKTRAYLTDLIPSENYDEVEEIMKALERESCNDVISRQAAIDSIWDGTNMDIYTREVKERLESLPSVQPKDCKDIISRTEAQKHIYARLFESALHNVGYHCDASDVFKGIAENMLNFWFSEIPSIYQTKESEVIE